VIAPTPRRRILFRTSRDEHRTMRRWLPCALAAFAACLCADSASAQTESASPDAPADDKSSFLFVPYPITEPALGSGVLAGPVWMRPGPATDAGPAKPQAFGAGVLWTNGGSRGLVAFDHRAWRGGAWRTTALGARADLHLSYHGLSPDADDGRGFTLRVRGASVSAEHVLGKGPHSIDVRLFSTVAQTDFDVATPPEIALAPPEQTLAGLGVGWSRDTRDDVYAPTHGSYTAVALTAYPHAIGSTFDAQALRANWTSYRSAFGKGVLGTRFVLEHIQGDPPFYIRPYVAFRGAPALRYAGEDVVSAEAELRWPVGTRWEVLAFGGAGIARADRAVTHASATVTAGGLGVRFKAKKYFGLTFGLDVAAGPDGTATYVQIGNAWAR
jgi:hypothetical protein